MSTYRLSLSLRNAIALGAGFLMLCTLLFFGGALVGFSSQKPALLAAACAAPATSPVVVARAEVPAPAATPAPSPAQEPAAVSEGAQEQNSYAVQVGVFRQPENARRMIALLERRGYEPVIVESQDDAGEVLTSVRIAEHADWNRAWNLAGEFSSRENRDAMVVLAQQ